jgi:Fe-S-cluster containining protein
MYENMGVCAKCGGMCCKEMPGVTSPEQWGIPLDEERVRKALRSGKWAVDWWEGDPRGLGYEDSGAVSIGYFIRPAVVGGGRGIFDPTWGGRCVFLRENGCELPENDRPLGCKLLEPNASNPGKCKMHGEFSKKEAAIAWLPYYKTFESLHALLQEKE